MTQPTSAPQGAQSIVQSSSDETPASGIQALPVEVRMKIYHCIHWLY